MNSHEDKKFSGHCRSPRREATPLKIYSVVVIPTPALVTLRKRRRYSLEKGMGIIQKGYYCLRSQHSVSKRSTTRVSQIIPGDVFFGDFGIQQG
ncbi:hypothetical protein PoB_004852200 [Plakobranchus ocellatus]|uniref:Cyclic nucleotide-binding domain-containing protein n=1 Tax=Plakobranchus ocellatus TaxID=259542 RepID=A0AAV4BRQ2_9GAST|nr:hypothetical protein PoB_004852200 [Plakobranchus ocellatus]